MLLLAKPLAPMESQSHFHSNINMSEIPTVVMKATAQGG